MRYYYFISREYQQQYEDWDEVEEGAKWTEEDLQHMAELEAEAEMEEARLYGDLHVTDSMEREQDEVLAEI